MKNTLEGRSLGILIADGSDGTIVSALAKAANDAGAQVKIVAPKVGGTKLADGSTLKADGQLAGTPRSCSTPSRSSCRLKAPPC